MHREKLGIVTGGSFNDGLEIRLDGDTSPEALRVGEFCVVQGEQHLYFSMIQNLRLHATDARLTAAPPPSLSPFLLRALRGTSTYAVAEVQPMLMVPRLPEAGLESDVPAGVQPVRTIPLHFTALTRARAEDFATVFGQDTGQGDPFAMGTPLTMEMAIPINLARLVERSTGIFGATGSGKSYLARLLLCGIISRRSAVTLIFDMHNEYAFGTESEEQRQVKGLKDLFGSRVAVFSLDPRSRGRDFDLTIGLDEISIGDVLSLAEELGLPAGTAQINLMMLQRRYGATWLRSFIELGPEEVGELAADLGAHPGSLLNAHRRLARLAAKSYVTDERKGDVWREMLRTLERGRHVILHFGRYDDSLDQILVANMVTRRIRELYQEKTEAFLQSRRPADRPTPLVIAVEEAHRFLNPAMARQTIFGTIARELRKYYVTLLIIDQRPSGIDDEILSQVGTRISGKLLDERDLEAVLSGVANRRAIRAGLLGLDSKQQIMLFGHAVPMPISLRTRRYDEPFFQAVTRDLAPERPPVTVDGAPAASRPVAPEGDDFERDIDLLFGGKP